MTSPLELSYWDEEEGELWGYMSDLIIATLFDGMQGGILTLPKNIRTLVDWDWLNKAALDYARTYRYSWIKGINNTTRTQVQQAVQEWINSGAPLSSLEAQLEPIFGEVRAAMIAATETTRVYADANVMTWESSEVVDSNKWNTVEDDRVCIICGPLDGEIRPLGESFGTNLKGDPIIRPPDAHIGDRCYLTPVVSEEKLAEKLERILG